MSVTLYERALKQRAQKKSTFWARLLLKSQKYTQDARAPKVRAEKIGFSRVVSKEKHQKVASVFLFLH